MNSSQVVPNIAGSAIAGDYQHLSFSPNSYKSGFQWPPQVADHLIPNRILRLFEFQGERERGKFSVFKGLQKPLPAQIQKI
jgi:hypothetical protein